MYSIYDNNFWLTSPKTVNGALAPTYTYLREGSLLQKDFWSNITKKLKKDLIIFRKKKHLWGKFFLNINIHGFLKIENFKIA